MKRIFLLAVVLLCFSFVVPKAVFAKQTGFNVTEQDCGQYHYKVTRILDGFFIEVMDGSRVRTILYRDVFGKKSVYQDGAKLIDGCYQDTIAFYRIVSSRYGAREAIDLIKPNEPELQIQTLSTRISSYWFGESTIETVPETATFAMDDLLSREQVSWSLDRTGLVNQKRILAEKSDALSDKSYYVFNGNGGVTRKLATSDWNWTYATDSIACDGGVSYTVFVKRFSQENTSTSTYPSWQYIIEKSGDGARVLIPVPHVKDWKLESDGSYGFSDSARIKGCSGKNVVLRVYERLTMLTGATRVTDYKDSNHSIVNARRIGYDDEFTIQDEVYYEPGILRLHENGVIDGSSVIRILNADGAVSERRPLYFKNLRDYPVGTSMRFELDSQDPDKILVQLSFPGSIKEGVSYEGEVSYFLESNGVYSQVSRSSDDSYQPDRSYGERMTGIHVSLDNGVLTVKSPFLKNAMVLQKVAGKNSKLLWSRVGPLELDGTRKVWYGIKVDGRTETWLARVR